MTPFVADTRDALHYLTGFEKSDFTASPGYSNSRWMGKSDRAIVPLLDGATK
jgi:hypothetical protein